MKFKKIQDGKTFDIISYFIDGKKVTAQAYESKLNYSTYNSSLTITDPKTGNFIHSHSQN